MTRLLRVKDFPLFSVLVLAGMAAALPLLSRHPRFVEKFYAQYFYPHLTKKLTALAGGFAFSISEIALYASILGLLWLLSAGILQRKWKRMLVQATRWLALAVTWFYLGWGCNYYRLPLEEQLQLQSGGASADSSALRENFLWSLEAANAFWREIPAWDLTQLNEEIEMGYGSVCDTLQIALMPGERRPKFLLFPGLFDYTLTSGMFGPFFHEVHLNAGLLPVELPFVLAHEKAHQMGFAREAEANFLAALVCWMSADSAVQYSGYFALLGHFWTRAAQWNEAEALQMRLRPEVRADFAAVRQRWQIYQGPVSELSHKSYDVYLRANRVEGGVQNYNDVVDLIVRWRQQQITKNHSAGEDPVRYR